MNFQHFKKNNTSKFLKKQKGFSLIEMLIYISLLAVIFLLVVNTVLSFTSSYRQLGAERSAENSAIDAMERMSHEIQAAHSVDTTNSVFGTSPGTLSLISTSNGVSTTTEFYIQNNQLDVSVNGTYSGPLTLSGASVTSLVFTLMSTSTVQAVKIDMTIAGVSGPVTRTKMYHTTVILKG